MSKSEGYIHGQQEAQTYEAKGKIVSYSNYSKYIH